jgi:hypothetical protein
MTEIPQLTNHIITKGPEELPYLEPVFFSFRSSCVLIKKERKNGKVRKKNGKEGRRERNRTKDKEKINKERKEDRGRKKIIGKKETKKKAKKKKVCLNSGRGRKPQTAGILQRIRKQQNGT